MLYLQSRGTTSLNTKPNLAKALYRSASTLSLSINTVNRLITRLLSQRKTVPCLLDSGPQSKKRSKASGNSKRYKVLRRSRKFWLQAQLKKLVTTRFGLITPTSIWIPQATSIGCVSRFVLATIKTLIKQWLNLIKQTAISSREASGITSLKRLLHLTRVQLLWCTRQCSRLITITFTQ